MTRKRRKNYMRQLDSLFSKLPSVSIQRSAFSRDHVYKTTCNAGELIPIFCDEVLPGDTFTLKHNILSRITTLVVPIMDDIYFDTHFFFVPNRLVWDNFQKFMGQQDNPGDSIDYLVPQLNTGTSGVADSTIFDYFGIPIKVPNLSFNSLPFRAYNLIYNEWFRDENLIDSVPVPKGDGPDKLTDFKLLKRAKAKDYFTSALPWPQKGPGLSIPLGDTAPLKGINDVKLSSDGAFLFKKNETSYSVNLPRTENLTSFYDCDGNIPTGVKRLEYGSGIKISGLNNVVADLSHATPVTINSLRTAFQLQKFAERMARGGSRYTEIIRSHFGVVSPDARLQRPEYLGGQRATMMVNSAVQTSATTTTPLGNLGAFGVLASNATGFSKSFTEHGYIIGVMSIRTNLTYQQGLNKMWSRKTREDFYWPTFAHLGEQAVLNKEIFAQGNAKDEEVFGYQERYAEYRYKPSMITGKLRSNADGSLDVWHLAQKFANLPTLNKTFVEENVPMSRVLAVTNEPAFKVDINFNLRCVRPMPVYSVPGLVDHF